MSDTTLVNQAHQATIFQNQATTYAILALVEAVDRLNETIQSGQSKARPGLPQLFGSSVRPMEDPYGPREQNR